MLHKTCKSLRDLLGEDYVAAVCAAANFLTGMDPAESDRLACTPVDAFPKALSDRLDQLLPQVGCPVVPPLLSSNDGATTDAFKRASKLSAAPLGGCGPFRIGEDGRLYLAAKSEHYQLSVGHQFPGYRLVDRARSLGIPNATHNNTRGYITRLLERELVRHANGLGPDDAALQAVLESRAPRVLNRVINIETGSLAVEAGIKIMLRRFYRQEPSEPLPEDHGKIPVFLVISDQDGGLDANYHGTTVIGQSLRGLWPELYRRCATAGAYQVVGVRYNDIGDFRAKIETYNSGAYRTAGFLHEIVMMNFGGILLDREYLQQTYELCRAYGTPVMADEIQSCMWYSGLFLFRRYGLHPDFVILGKGFPGGEFPASRVITTAEMDRMYQFGALVTNGQEELASLAYLITMAFVLDHGDEIDRMGAYLEQGLRSLQNRFPDAVVTCEGLGHLASIHFKTMDLAARFAQIMNSNGIDISAQTYKTQCPPAALMKLPLVTSAKAMDYLVSQAEKVINSL